ncbi:hypothetical protein QMK32_23090 [Rhodococcus sp. H29-C3]|nr:hypothetical protein [Rhodococcus sp. H29-C3]
MSLCDVEKVLIVLAVFALPYALSFLIPVAALAYYTLQAGTLIAAWIKNSMFKSFAVTRRSERRTSSSHS